MTVHEQAFLTGFAAQVAAATVEAFKAEGLYHDDRPLLTLEQAAARLGISRRVLGDLIAPGKDGSAPALATVKVIPGGQKGVMIEPRTIDAYLEERRRATWVASAGRDGV